MGLGNPHEARWRQLAIYHLSLTTRDEWRDGFFTNRADEQFHIVTEDRLPKVINLHVLKEGVVGAKQDAYFQGVDRLIGFQQSLANNAEKTAASALDTLRLAVITLAVLALVTAAVVGVRITKSTTAPLQEAVDLARAVAAGDLTRSIRAEGRSETAQLLQALGDMQNALITLVSNVHQGAEAVSNASAEIAQGNSDLSSRTESQASSLEETAASMEQLNSTVRQNAENARQASQMAHAASTVAVQGGAVVSDVVRTMKEINESSNRISDIIGVIDSIAFQTNILALNAAVEAARAGEQGRGFAVVASEVRSLAGRSAEAAREIKSLISASVERVEAGSTLVDQAGQTMSEVVTSIRRVTDIVSEISAASSALPAQSRAREWIRSTRPSRTWIKPRSRTLRWSKRWLLPRRA